MFNPKTLVDTSAAELEQHFRVNQLGVFLGMKAVIEPLQATKGGSIVNISSVSAMRAIPGQFAYAASKWAVRGMTGSAAFELARLGIRVNAVYPGLINTPMIAGNSEETNAHFTQYIPLGRIGQANEVAELVRLSRLGRGKLHQRRRDRNSVINFASDSAEVPASTREFLQKAADDLKRLPTDHVVEIAGYTDNTGDEALNVALSQRRADAVREALIKFGAAPDTLVAKGYGSADPIASNDTPEGRKRNRRIEYHIVKTPT